jgi:hypothetical protein
MNRVRETPIPENLTEKETLIDLPIGDLTGPFFVIAIK